MRARALAGRLLKGGARAGHLLASAQDRRNAPSPWDKRAVKAQAVAARLDFGKAKRASSGVVPAAFALVFARLSLWRPVRAVQTYVVRRGPLLAAGSAYYMFFSVAAMLVAGFSLFGAVMSQQPQLLNLIIDAISQAVPGLIADNAGNNGLATREQLFHFGTNFGWAVIVSIVTLIFTSINWISGLRAGIRTIFGLPPLTENVFVRLAKDTLILIALFVGLAAAALAGFSTVFGVKWLLSMLGWDSEGWGLVGLFFSTAVPALVDVVMAVLVFRFAAVVWMPRAVAWQTILIATAGTASLRLFSTLLLPDVAARNPLLAPFSVTLGLFVWFYLLSQIYLLAAGWGAVGRADYLARRG